MDVKEIHVWSASLEFSSSDLEHLYEILDPYERHRASRFRFLKDQKQFIAARGLLRHILSLYIHCEPARFQFCRNAFGKPELGCDSTNKMQDLRFNYSHSHALAVFAFARNREVGIDVERIQQQIAEETVPEHLFSRSEVSALRTLPGTLQAEAFFRVWTRKEAYVKARGEGFRIPLDSFEVSSDQVAMTDGESSNWSLQSFVPAVGYLAALSAEGQGWRTRFIDCNDYPSFCNERKTSFQLNHKVFPK